MFIRVHTGAHASMHLLLMDMCVWGYAYIHMHRGIHPYIHSKYTNGKMLLQKKARPKCVHILEKMDKMI